MSVDVYHGDITRTFLMYFLIFQIIVVLGSFITIAAVFSFIEDCCKKSPSIATCLPSDGDESISHIHHTDDIEDHETSLNINTPVRYDNRQLKVNIPVKSRATAAFAASSSDNEQELDDEQLSDTAALLPTG